MKQGRHRSRAVTRFFHAVATAAVVMTLVPAGTTAGECPAVPAPNLPVPATPVNLGKIKGQLREYKEKSYDADVIAVFAAAHAFVEQRAGQVKRPAAVLDIDETSLSNWPSIKADDFGFIPGGACTLEPNLACGFNEWVGKASAKALPGAVEFFNAAVAKNVAVFFITGRHDSQRQVTLRNLNSEGFQGWTGLRTRPDDDPNTSVVPYKSGERKKIQADGYTIIANIGDQQSDLAGDKDGDYAECPFKVPNPFYFIP